ncbi:MAG: hydroxyacid dehydrogenase [Spirochaetaceae bacterium]|jgi:D-3-phosphoglycerate dehydrogenase|nr:hydroxyacid dehydrogenase [Spirochaetaceae bacterium]
MKILIPEPIAQSGKDYLIEKGYTLLDNPLKRKEEIIENIKDCDGIIVRILKYDKEVIDAGKSLRVISKHGVGVDNIDINYCTQKKIQVTFTPAGICNAVAEHSLFMMMACAKNATIVAKHFLEDGEFDVRNQILGIELYGKTVGILGLGRIGRSLAQKCLGIGMKVIAYDPYISQEQVGNDICMMDRDEVLKNADFVSMNLPCTDETKGAFGDREFSLMKKTAYFINSARGALVQHEALVRALQDNIIRGAGIDVFEKEPPDRDDPLLEMENVFITPHYAGSTNETMMLVSLHAAMGIDEVLSRKKISWSVNHIQ